MAISTSLFSCICLVLLRHWILDRVYIDQGSHFRNSIYIIASEVGFVFSREINQFLCVHRNIQGYKRQHDICNNYVGQSITILQSYSGHQRKCVTTWRSFIAFKGHYNNTCNLTNKNFFLFSFFFAIYYFARNKFWL